MRIIPPQPTAAQYAADSELKVIWPLVPAVGEYLTAPASARSAGVVNADRVYWVPVPITEPMSFDRIAAEVTTEAVSAVLRLGLFLDASSDPGARLIDAGTIDASSTGFKQITIDVSVARGVLWLTSASQGVGGATAQYRRATTSVSLPAASPAGSTHPQAWVQTGVSGAFPATAVPDSSSSTPAMVWLRRSA